MLSFIGCALFTAAASFVCLLLLVFILSKRRTSLSPMDAIIVLGAKVNPDKRPSNTLMYRLDAAYDTYLSIRPKAVIVTSGRGADEPEAEAFVMKRYLVDKGVPASVVHEDASSKNTIENLRNAKSIMDRVHLSSAVLLTTDYHTARALTIARRIGIRPCCAVPSRPGRKPSTRLIAYAREVLSWAYLIIKLLLKKL